MKEDAKQRIGALLKRMKLKLPEIERQVAVYERHVKTGTLKKGLPIAPQFTSKQA